MMNLTAKKVISLVLSLALLVSCMSGCTKPTADGMTPIDTEAIASIITETIASSAEADRAEESSIPLIPSITYDLADHVGNIDTLVYGLLASEYELCYRVFDASIELPDGSVCYGIGYTDFADYYEADDGYGFFPAGFIPLIGESAISAEAIEKGLEITDIENETESSFVLAYETKPFMEHCVVWEQYLKYGVDSAGGITYSYSPYVRGVCDESIGALYSYDEQKYVFDPDVGDYKFINGVSLSEQIDYKAIEAEINRIIEEQDYNFASVDVESAFYFAQETVCNYLLSMQEESFLGYTVAELVATAETLDPSQCIRITPTGHVIINVEDAIPNGSEQTAKWLVGIGCGIAVAASIALDIFVPAMRPVSGAISGAAVEVFMQVVIQNQSIDNIKWSKVAVAATSGALMAWACPLAAASAVKGVVNAAGTEVITLFGKEIATEAVAKLAGYAVLTFSNAVVSGATGATMTYLDGKTTEEAMDAFLWGFAIGGAITILGSAASELGNKAMNALAQKNPNNWFIKASESAGTWIGKHQLHLKNQALEDILAPKSVYEAAKCAMNELQLAQAPEKILQQKIAQLPADKNKNFVKIGPNGEPISKAELLENGGNCVIRLKADCDPQVAAQFEKLGVSEIVVTNGNPDFGPIALFSFTPDGGIGPNRAENMLNFFDQIADDWSEHPDRIPEAVRQFLTDSQIENLDGKMVQQALSLAKITLHEGIDGVVYAVDHLIHNKIGHYGGVAYAKAMEALQMGTIYIKDLLHAPVTAIWSTIVAEEVG